MSFKLQDGRHSVELSAPQIQLLADKLNSDPKMQAQFRALFGLKEDDSETPAPSVVTAPVVQTQTQTSAPTDFNSGKAKPEATTSTQIDGVRAPQISSASDILALVKDYSLPRRIKFSENGYVPNARPLFTLLHEMDRYIIKNFQARRSCLSLNPVANRIFFTIIWNVQVARCMQYDNRLEPEDARTLERFLISFPPEKIHIPGPLLPFFKAITTYKPQNELHRRVSPQFPTVAISDSSKNAEQYNYTSAMFPSPPMTIALLKKIYDKMNTFDDKKSVNDNLGINDVFPFEKGDDYDTDGKYKNDVKLAGYTFKKDPSTWAGNAAQSLCGPALMFPPELNPDVMKHIKDYGVDFSLPTVDDDLMTDDLADWLCMNKMKWFKTFLAPMAEYANLWIGSGSLADCSVDGPSTGAYIYKYSASEDKPAKQKKAFDKAGLFDLNGCSYTTQGTPEPIAERMAVLTQVHCKFHSDHPQYADLTPARCRFGTVWNSGPIYGPSSEDMTYDSISESIVKFVNPALLKLARD